MKKEPDLEATPLRYAGDTDNYEVNPRKGTIPHVKKDMFAEGSVSFPTKFNNISESGVL